MAFVADSSVSMNGGMANGSLNNVPVYGRHEFLKSRTLIATPVIVLISLACIVGTLGNFFILLVVCSNKLGRNVTTTFIMNLAVSDMIVTLIVDPMSLIGKRKLSLHSSFTVF